MDNNWNRNWYSTSNRINFMYLPMLVLLFVSLLCLEEKLDIYSLLYSSPCGIGRLELSDCQGPFEFYHLESIDQSKFHSFNTITSKSTKQKHDRTYHILSESFNSQSSSSSSSSSSTHSKTNMWFDNNFSIKNHSTHNKSKFVKTFSFPSKNSTPTVFDSNISFNHYHHS